MYISADFTVLVEKWECDRIVVCHKSLFATNETSDMIRLLNLMQKSLKSLKAVQLTCNVVYLMTLFSNSDYVESKHCGNIKPNIQHDIFHIAELGYKPQTIHFPSS
jgi:hypothetical protein